MLTHEEIATIVRRHSMYPGETIEQRLESAIRLAIAETAEACAQRADAVSALYKEGVRGSYQITSVSKASAAAEVAADIRAVAKGAK